jgi:hypothetical protein
MDRNVIVLRTGVSDLLRAECTTCGEKFLVTEGDAEIALHVTISPGHVVEAIREVRDLVIAADQVWSRTVATFEAVPGEGAGS